MDTFEIQGLTFRYPGQTESALDRIDLTVRQGDFLVLCGPSGGGKTTLLRTLKPALAPHGQREGTVLFEGVPLDSLNFRDASAKIGFVMQDPDNQLVTDKVWHELAFGLESLGYDTPVIRRRVAEMASFFGIEDWFYRDAASLSGGQKQLINLASVMVMQPKVLLLDEPTAQLDPIAAADFLEAVAKINRELGVTVIITEHRLEEALPLALRAAVLERGRIIADGVPSEVGDLLLAQGHGMFSAMPTPMRVWVSVKSELPCPVTVREGRRWLTEYLKSHEPMPTPVLMRSSVFASDAPILTSDNVWFRYEKAGPDILKGLSLSLHQGELFAMLGVNGAGKSTCLRILSGLDKPNRGEVSRSGQVALLPQNPKALFKKKTVRDDLLDAFSDFSGEKAFMLEKFNDFTHLCLLDSLLDRHPYDLSGGEQQRAALCKVLMCDPDILLLDEPTKGMDAQFKLTFAEILKNLKIRSKAILLVSHDIEFCALCADTCGLLFDGALVAAGSPQDFFAGNSFYTTAASRMSRDILPECVTPQALIAACGGVAEEAPENMFFSAPAPLPHSDVTSSPEKPLKLPIWRKAVAFCAAGVALMELIAATRAADFTVLRDLSGGAEVLSESLMYTLVFLLSLIVFAAAAAHKPQQPDDFPQLPAIKNGRRAAAAAFTAIIAVPLTLYLGAALFGGKRYYFIALLVLLECMLPFFYIFEGRKPQARELVVIAVLCAIGVAGRAAFFMLPQFKPVMALAIIAGVAFGGETGFLTGAMTMLVSNILFSQGPWTPWQMFAMGLSGFFAGLLFRTGFLPRARAALCIYGGIAAILIYGPIMNFASALLWQGSVNWGILLTYCATGLPMDLIHAAGTMVFLWFAALPMLEKLDRMKTKYGILS
ncbi:Vitamin B12 import ATP-binding protein BtuD [bioreactor metagenome]|uniref:Vitamin B12 import ATP-binding protein BtuD n=1 Tax=bioreactor metagenome TaxID=1076179 RepID=A0A644XQ57_9ZZZZ